MRLICSVLFRFSRVCQSGQQAWNPSPFSLPIGANLSQEKGTGSYEIYLEREGDGELWAQLESGFEFLALQPTHPVQLLPDLAWRMRISYFNSVNFDWDIFIMDSENRFGQLSEPALVGFSVPKKTYFHTYLPIYLPSYLLIYLPKRKPLRSHPGCQWPIQREN